MADSSFDIVSKVDRQEVDNALNQAAKELSQRFDFRGTDAPSPGPASEAITITANTEERVKAALDVFKEKLVKRGISLQGPRRRRARSLRQELQGHRHARAGHRLGQGQEDRQADQGRGPEGRAGADPGRPAARVREEEDDLQAVIALLKGSDLDIALQFTNYR